jgi:hypothetical protein
MMLLYLVGALITAGATFALAKHWRDVRQPAAHLAALSVVAGALWPVVVVGALQVGLIAALVSVLRHHRGLTADYALAR